MYANLVKDFLIHVYQTSTFSRNFSENRLSGVLMAEIQHNDDLDTYYTTSQEDDCKKEPKAVPLLL